MNQSYFFKAYVSLPKTLLGQSLAIKNSAQASLTLDSCKKLAVIIKLCTLEVEIVTFPLYAKLIKASKALASIEEKQNN